MTTRRGEISYSSFYLELCFGVGPIWRAPVAGLRGPEQERGRALILSWAASLDDTETGPRSTVSLDRSKFAGTEQAPERGLLSRGFEVIF